MYVYVYNIYKGVDNPFQKKIKDVVETGVRDCAHSLFIFDEVDKAPTKVIDALTIYMEPYDKINGVDYKKATFLFLR